MLNSSFKQTEEFTDTVLTESCCSELLLACGRECRFVKPQYHFVPEVCKKIDLVHQL